MDKQNLKPVKDKVRVLRQIKKRIKKVSLAMRELKEAAQLIEALSPEDQKWVESKAHKLMDKVEQEAHL